MACTRPIRGVRDRLGAVKLVKGIPDAALMKKHGFVELELPCGGCQDCRLETARSWAVRCSHEASLHRKNAFLTLTFSPEGLDRRQKERGTHPAALDKEDWQLFAKKVRNHFGPFRFLHVGEYGEENLRPHYHALVFGQDFRAKEETEHWTDPKTGIPYYLNRRLEKLWPYGFHTLGAVTPESINYCCLYAMKKITGKSEESVRLREARYKREDSSGQHVIVPEEHMTMSRNPGLGAKWFDRYANEVFPDDWTLYGDKKAKTPLYYTKRLEKRDPILHQEVRARRSLAAEKRIDENTPRKRGERARITRAKLGLKKARKLD